MSQVLLVQRHSLDSVLLRAWGREERQNDFVSPSRLPAAASLQCSDRLIFWKQQIGRPRTGQFLRMCRRRSVIALSCLILVVLSSQSFESNFPSLTKFCPGLFMGQREWMLMESTDVAKPASSGPVRGHLAPFL